MPVSASSGQRSRRQPQSRQDVGRLAELFVAQWLTEQRYEILQQRWYCRWGELDLIAQTISAPSTLIFIEVKARSGKNWDAGGLLAITPKKREKLWQTAELFLAENPALAALPCRFDVALVHYQVNPSATDLPLLQHWQIDSPRFSVLPSTLNLKPIQLGQPWAIGQYHLTLQNYLFNVFD
ncbi:YraN family protein [filamentous cyanobacterium CCP2]|nr:YraN family protein [filamentous cyanobacterium CCP2]